MRQEIIDILREIAPGIDPEDPETDLAQELESMDIIALITELEDRFRVTVTMRDKTEENFKNVDTLISMVQKLQ